MFSSQPRNSVVSSAYTDTLALVSPAPNKHQRPRSSPQRGLCRYPSVKDTGSPCRGYMSWTPCTLLLRGPPLCRDGTSIQFRSTSCGRVPHISGSTGADRGSGGSPGEDQWQNFPGDGETPRCRQVHLQPHQVPLLAIPDPEAAMDLLPCRHGRAVLVKEDLDIFLRHKGGTQSLEPHPSQIRARSGGCRMLPAQHAESTGQRTKSHP